jgi:Tol biopolymer transport system component
MKTQSKFLVNIFVLFAVLVSLLGSVTPAYAATTTTRISVDSSGAQGNNLSRDPSTSADGRYVAFFSYASNLVSGDTNGMPDIFVRDTLTNVTTRVSVNSNGTQGNNAAGLHPSISGDGRFVVFESLRSPQGLGLFELASIYDVAAGVKL